MIVVSVITHRTLHGALLDAEILADVYLLMTGGQTSLQLTLANKMVVQKVSEEQKVVNEKS